MKAAAIHFARNWKRILKKSLVAVGILATAVLLIGGGVVAFLALGSTKQADAITWGATFGHSQARDLGLDWKETYLALLDDVGVRNFRIPVYWNELETKKGQFNFEPWDWQLDQLQERRGKAFLAIGFKLPRWPECRMPDWARELPREEREKEILRMMEQVVNRYKAHEAVFAWQIENEPFLTFGDCPEKTIDEDQLDREIALVRRLDPSRPIILTDTGEHSIWIKTPGKADIFASTLFRIIHDPTLGFVRYPYPAIMYHRKAIWAKLWNPDVRIIIGELQAEPWVDSLPITKHSLSKQYETMSPELFRENMDFARRTGFDEFYLWGSEWWYWTKTKGGDSAIWEEVRKLFNTSKNR
ncbi:MAG: beta-galactosidase [Candidatus Wildermuthbacteria bacterium]|nr:beta-galactosidase [Candidatus Wildermuthbacteria bacterium]